MAITQTGVITGGNIKNYQGLSTDTKPVDCGSGSSFYELDTGKAWLYDANNENPVTENGWWEM